MSIFKPAPKFGSTHVAAGLGLVGLALWVAQAVVRSRTNRRMDDFDADLERRWRDVRAGNAFDLTQKKGN